MQSFRERHTLDERRLQFDRIRKHVPQRLPVVMENGRDTPRARKEKFLVPYDMTVAQLSYVIRKHTSMDASRSIFLFINGTAYSSTLTVRELYEKNKADDGFLYVVYAYENTFG